MPLNWTPENISNFILSAVMLIGVIFVFRKYSPSKLRVVLYLKLIWFAGGLFFLFEGFASFFIEPSFSRLSGIFCFFLAIALVMIVNYTLNESYTTFILLPLVSLGLLLCYAAFQPGAVAEISVVGYISFVWQGLFQVLAYGFIFFYLFFFLVWAIKIHRNAPFEIKSASNVFLLGALITSFPTVILNIVFFWISWYIFSANIAFVIGIIIISHIIKKEPKLLFVLPFTPYRILVMDRQGNLLHQHIWSQAEFKDPALTQFLGALQNTPTQLDSSRGVLEVRYKEGVLILHETTLVRVGLFVSKASILLRELLKKFSDQFEAQFRKSLEETKTDPAEYDAAHELIMQYFLIFPSRLIDEEKKPLFLSKKVYKIPTSLEAKLKEIVKDEKTFDSIKCEIQRSFEKGLPSEFLELYEELKDQTEESEENDSK